MTRMDLISKRLSFEFYPPKTFEGMKALMEVANTLTSYSPEFFSVTFGAGGSTRQRTLETLLNLRETVGIQVAPHLSCIGYDRAELLGIIEEYQKLDIKRLVVLRGDMPSGMVSSGDFEFAADFVKFIRVVSGDHFHIEVAAYPEFHPLAQTATLDVLNLKRKQDMGADSAITQYFYNPDAYFYFLDQCAHHQVTLPIYPGVMPITDYHKLVRFSSVCGAEVPRWLGKRLEAYGDDQASVKAFGLEMMHQLCERLLEGGAPGLHFYTLNQAEVCTKILEAFTNSNVMPLATVDVMEEAIPA